MTVPSLSRYLELLWSIILLIVDSLCLAFYNLVPYSWKHKKDIRNEIVLITGGNSGYGEQMSVKFAELGCYVVIWAMSEKKCKDVVARVKREVPGAHKVHYYVVDVSDRLSVYETAEKVKKDVGEVTILVNNAGTAQGTLFLDTPDSVLEKMLTVNAMAHFWTLKAFLPNMMKNNHGHLVTVGSISSLAGIAKVTSYAAGKHAALGFLDSIAMELIECGKTNIKTTVVCPSFTKTPLYTCEYDGIAPIMTTEFAVDKIMKGVLTDQQMVYIRYSNCLLPFLSRLTTKKALWRIIKNLGGDGIYETVQVRTSVFDDQKEMNLKE